jgi:hypothetical protein
MLVYSVRTENTDSILDNNKVGPEVNKENSSANLITRMKENMTI